MESSLDESFARTEGGWGAAHCPAGGGWTVEGDELRYRWTPCVSTLSLSLHLTRPGFAEFQYQLSKEGSRGLVQMLQVRNAQCQSYGLAKASIQNIVQLEQKHAESIAEPTMDDRTAKGRRRSSRDGGRTRHSRGKVVPAKRTKFGWNSTKKVSNGICRSPGALPSIRCSARGNDWLFQNNL